MSRQETTLASVHSSLDRVLLDEDSRGRRVLTLQGDWDISTDAELAAALAKAIVPSSRRLDLTVDLCGATFMDTAALARLVSLRRTVTRRSGKLIIRCAPGDVHRTVIELRLAAPLNVYVRTH